MNNTTVKILCSTHCKHCSNDGYYNLCHHPAAKNTIPYAGIDRYYLEKCELYEKPDIRE